MNTVSGQIRPIKFNEYIGQESIKKNLNISIEAAKQRADTLEHILLYGPPGLGKTTLAMIIANEIGVNFVQTSAPAISQKKEMAAILTDIKEEGTILFIDEIHRLNKAVEELLYPAMEDFKLFIMIGEGPGARNIEINLPSFSLIGATTRAGGISSPMRDRFGMNFKLDFYKKEEIIAILFRSSKVIDVELTQEGAEIIAERSKATPRIANKLLKRVRDFAQIRNNNFIDKNIAITAFDHLGIDKSGLDKNDIDYLQTLLYKFNGGPVGIDNISTAINEDKTTVEDMIEPFLIRLGLIKRTPKGRIATNNCYGYFGLKQNSSQKELFDE